MAKHGIRADKKRYPIHPEIYGNFSEHLGRCIYEGIYVGEDSPIPNVNGMRTDVVEALKKLSLPVLRWPGGCFADEYHWKDGIGEKATRKKMVNTHWGGVAEDNSFGTHEFMELCRQVGCKAYINGNVGSGTVQEMAEWIEYMTFDGVSPMAELRARNGHPEPWKVDFFGVGNENWGCGGNMRPEYYADVYRRYQTYVRNFGKERIYKIACGAGTSMETPNYEWTETLMKNAGRYMNGLSLHYYTVPGDWKDKTSATGFDEDLYYITLYRSLFMDELVTRHGTVMDRYDPEKRVGMIVDEWGTWYDVEPGTNPGFLYQQNTMRDAMVAGTTLNIFNKHADRVRMANIAQTVNVLQAVILTDGAQMILTPTYHVFEMYKVHQGATLLDSCLETDRISQHAIPQLQESASMDDQGRIHATICNLSATESAPVELTIQCAKVQVAEAVILTGNMDDHNTFENGTAVEPAPFTGIQTQVAGENTLASFTLPACSVARITFQ